MKHLRNLAVACCSVLLLSQCASKDEIRDLSYQIRAVNQKVEEVRGITVDQMQKRQASSVSRLDEVQNEVMQLRAVIEENAHQETLFREQSKEDVASLKTMIERLQAENVARLKTLEDRVSQLERNLDKLTDARIREAEQRAREAARRAEEARRRTVVAASGGSGYVRLKPTGRKVAPGKSARVETPPPVTPSEPGPSVSTGVTPPPEAGSGGDRFSRAMSLYKKKNYVEAYKAFEEVLSSNPKGDEAAETLFFMGESLFARGDFDLAILDYQKVISNHAGHPRTPTALLKQGMSFEKLTDYETAKIIYRKLVAEYPDSAEAATARQQLESLQ